MASCTEGRFPFVTVRNFTPNSRVNWIPVGNIASHVRNGNAFTLNTAENGLANTASKGANPPKLSSKTRT